MISLVDIDKKATRMPAYTGGYVRKGGHSQRKVVWMAMFTPGLEGRRGLPYVLVSEPATVKTSTIKQFAKRAQLPFWSVLGSLRQPVDFMGCPVPQRRKLGPMDQHLSPDGEADLLYMHYAPAGFGVEAALAQNGVILFDEANNMPPAVQSAMLRVLFEGVCGELEIPPGIRMFLATNDLEDAAGGWQISRALESRMGWLEWEGNDVERFSGYLAATGGRGSTGLKVETIDWREEQEKADELYDERWPWACQLVTGFLKRRDLLHQKPKSTDRARGWPNSRAWEFLSHALTGSFVYDLSGMERQMACAAYVGSAAYGEFYAYAKSADLPDPDELLEGKVTFRHNPGRLDRTAAVLAGCAARVLPEEVDQRKEKAEALWSFIKGLPDDATDIVMPQVIQMTQANLMLGSNTAYQVLAKLDPVMDAGGV
jgi:hypothetical protein